MPRPARLAFLPLAALLARPARGAAPSVFPGTPPRDGGGLGAPAPFDGPMVWASRRGRALLFGGDGEFGVPYFTQWQFLRTPEPHWERLGIGVDGPPLRS